MYYEILENILEGEFEFDMWAYRFRKYCVGKLLLA
jgi:hypothetical protein